MRWGRHDYRQPGVYFVTICTHDRACVLGRVEDDRVRLSPVGRIARDCWIAIPDHFPHAGLDAYVIMPNHVHGLVIIRRDTDSTGGDDDNRGRDTKCRVSTSFDKSSSDLHAPRTFGQPVAGSLSRIIGAYKAAVTRQARPGARFSVAAQFLRSGRPGSGRVRSHPLVYRS